VTFLFGWKPRTANTSDKTELPKVVKRVQKFKKQLQNAPQFRWIGDSALYSKSGVLNQKGYTWITRVPETLSEAKTLVHKPEAEIEWVVLEKGYKAVENLSEYGGVKQRYILFFSEAAYEREKKTAGKRLLKLEKKLKTELWHISNAIFSCEKDCMEAIKKIQKKFSLFTLSAEFKPILKNSKRGRPSSNAEKVITGYRAICTAQVNDEAYAHYLQTKGRFILATNELNTKTLPLEEVLAEYKEQQGVERGFRFLKDPWFMADSVFLKSPRRIKALMMVMTLSLLIYNVAQYRIREALKEQNETLPNQLNKPIQNPTLRWIFQIMEGISVATILIKNKFLKSIVTNITEIREKIISLFGKKALEIYGFS
jgi:transposase